MRTKISEFSATPGDNTDIDGIDIAEGCAPSGINNAIRELMAQLKDMQTGASGDTFTLTTVNSTTVDTTNLEATNLKAKDGTAAGSIANSTGVVTLASSVLTTTDINGGTVDGTTIGATTPSTVVATQVDITAQGDLRLQDTTGGQYVALQAPGTIATSYTLTLPVDDGTSGQALITDGSGVLSWSTAASGDVYGPASATDNAVARYDGTTGKIIQNSAVTIGDDGATVIAANSSSDGLRITQLGGGNALLVEDSANPDATPVVIDNGGNLILGSTTLASTPSTFVSTIQSHSTANQSLGIGFFNYATGTASRGDVAFYKSLSGTSGTLSAVSTNTDIGSLNFFGAGDASTWVRAGIILAEVDTGTISATSMPGRLVFATTPDGSATSVERMRINSAGNVGIGTSSITGYGLRVGKTADAAAYVGVGSTGSGNSTSTTAIYNFYSIATTTANGAVPYTISSIRHYDATQTTFNADSTVANQYGFIANSSLTGATNNYGFYGNIASGAGRFNFYAQGTAANVFAGTTSIGGLVGAESLRVTPVASAVNYLNAQGAVTTAAPSITAAGSDTNIDITLTPKGTGNVRFGTYTAGILAQAGYIQIKDAAGNVRNLLVG